MDADNLPAGNLSANLVPYVHAITCSSDPTQPGLVLHVPLTAVLGNADSLIGAAVSFARQKSHAEGDRKGDVSIDLSRLVQTWSTPLLLSVQRFYTSGELRVPTDVSTFDAMCCWNEFNVYPALPPLLSPDDARDIPSLCSQLHNEFLTFHAADLRALCKGELKDLVVILPIWIPQHHRDLLQCLILARSSQISASEDGPANGSSMTGRTGFESFAATEATLSRLCAAPLITHGLGMFASAKDNVALCQPMDLNAAINAAEVWLHRAIQSSALARMKWAQHVFLRALAAHGLEAVITPITVGKGVHGVYDYSGQGTNVRLAWFPWTPPSSVEGAVGWRIPNGEAVRVEIIPHWSC